jgi:hypothetical protein
VLANGEVREVVVTESLELRLPAEEGWEVAKHNLPDLGFEELGQQIAKSTSVIHPKKDVDNAYCFMDEYKASQERWGNQ